MQIKYAISGFKKIAQDKPNVKHCCENVKKFHSKINNNFFINTCRFTFTLLLKQRLEEPRNGLLDSKHHLPKLSFSCKRQSKPKKIY